MRVKITAALGLTLAVAAHAQSDCFTRYSKVYDLSSQAYWNAPKSERDGLNKVQQSLLVVLGYLDFDPASLPADVCTTTLQRVEAQAMVWHDKGWTPTKEEKEAAERAAALKELDGALAALEGKR